MTNAILITNLSKSYAETVVFRDFSARLPLGEASVITGVSGGGKTTLLRDMVRTLSDGGMRVGGGADEYRVDGIILQLSLIHI